MTGLDITSTFAAIVGAAHVRPALPADAIRGVTPGIVVEPATEQEVADVLRVANDAGLAVIPRGAGTKREWGNPPSRADVVLSMLRLDRIVDHAWADLTVIVEAGCAMADLQETLRARGQRVAMDPLWADRATVGGVLASNDSGALRLRFGALRDLIIGMTVVLPDGTAATSGGRVVKNVAGYDLPKLMTGALGTLGVITRAIFRLHPRPRHSSTVSMDISELHAAQRVIELIQDAPLGHTALQLRVSGADAPVIDVLFEGSPGGIAAQIGQLRTLIEAVPIRESPAGVWQARELLWSEEPGSLTLKLAVPMTRIADALSQVRNAAASGRWRAVFYATGLGWTTMTPRAGHVEAVRALRDWTVVCGGSAVVLRQMSGVPHVDAWGGFGDAHGLMQEVRRQFDPKATINPGRLIDPGPRMVP